MYWLLRTAVVLVLLVVVNYGVGLLIPAERTAPKTALIEGAPELVYRLITDVEGHPQWRSDIRSVTVDEKGPLLKWTEIHEAGVTVYVQEKVKEPLERYEIDFEVSNGLHGRWIGALEPSSENRTKMTCSETIVIENPMFRLPGFVFLNMGTSVDVFLGDLNRQASKATDMKLEAEAEADSEAKIDARIDAESAANPATAEPPAPVSPTPTPMPTASPVPDPAAIP